METLSIKISKDDKLRLRQLALQRKVSLSALLREGLKHIVQSGTDQGEASCYSRAAKYLEPNARLGARGLGDLSTNKKRMEGFGGDAGSASVDSVAEALPLRSNLAESTKSPNKVKVRALRFKILFFNNSQHLRLLRGRLIKSQDREEDGRGLPWLQLFVAEPVLWLSFSDDNKNLLDAL
jgi:hypothetical protein